MSAPLVLSLFPGLDGLGMGFAQEGFCVVAGPDLKWGRRIQDFHPVAGRFDGIIGGPPCQRFSSLAHLIRATRGEDALAEDLIPEFERCVAEARPTWFVMENSPFAPTARRGLRRARPHPQQPLARRHHRPGQQRRRRISFGTLDGRQLALEVALFESPEWERAILASEGRTGWTPPTRGVKQGPNRHRKRDLARALELQGFPADTLEQAPFTMVGGYSLVGNAVPIPMARAIAAAVRRCGPAG